MVEFWFLNNSKNNYEIEAKIQVQSVPRWTSSSAVFANNYTDHIKVVFRKAAYSLLKRVEISENGIIRDILRSDAFRSSALYARWEELLRGR